MADIITNTLQIGSNNLILRDADAQEQLVTVKDGLSAVDYAIAESIPWEVGAENYAQNWADGSISSNNSCTVTKYTDISGYKYIKYPAFCSTSSSTRAGIAFFSGKTVGSYISGVKAYENAPQTSMREQVAEVPEGAVYARFTIFETEVSNFYINGFKSITDRIDSAESEIDSIGNEIDSIENEIDANEYTIVDLFDSFVIGGISGAGAATTDNTRARTYKALQIPQGAYIECDPTIEYKVCYYTSNNAYRDTFEEVVPSAFTSDPIDLTVGRYAKLIVRYKASPSSEIEDASVLAGLVNVKIKMLTSEIKPLTNMYLSVMGDSMSAMAGYVPEGNDIYYSGSNHGVTSVDQMWWQVLCQKTGMIRCLINAWSGSGVTQLTDSSHLRKTPMSDTSRCSNLGYQAMTPDVIVIAGGTNDYTYAEQASQEPLEWDGLQAPQDSTSFTQQYALMIHRIQENYPDAIIVCCSTFFTMRGTDNGYTRTHTSGSNTYTQDDYDTAIKHVCSLMGVPFIEIRNIGFNQNNYYPKYAPDSATIPTHTNAAGQAVIGNAVAEKIVELVKGYVDRIVR